MSIIDLQADDKLRLPEGAELVVRQRGLSTRFTMLLQGGFAILNTRLAEASTLTYRLFFKLAEDLHPKHGNVAPLHIPSLMELFEIKQRALYNAMQVLKDADLMRKHSRGHYLLNPHVVWCGRTKERVQAVQAWDAQTVLYQNGAANA